MIKSVVDTVTCNCSDARDRIFALFSLMRSSSDEVLATKIGLVADYSLSVEQVYSGTAALLVASGFLGTVLKLAIQTTGRSHRFLPSWVPDWSHIPVDMREIFASHTSFENASHHRDNALWKWSSDQKLAPHSELLSQEVAEAQTKSNAGFVLRTGFPKPWNNGAITIPGLLLGKVNMNGSLIHPQALDAQHHSHPYQSTCSEWAVRVLSRDKTIAVVLREKAVGSEDHVF